MACGSDPGTTGSDAPPGPGEIDASLGDAADDAPSDAAAAADAAAPEALALTSTGFLTIDGDLVFPASACAPVDESPPFEWTGVPPAAQSLALTFVDEDNGATKWVVWNIPPSVSMLPANLSKLPHPTEIPDASQLGSLGHTGYAGPGVPGPPMHTYSFVLWAVDVAELPGTDGLTTAEIRETILPQHAIATSDPLVAKGQRGGP
jgi:Raf kinase inhibitor-like YbhB/YbcL family protein